MRPMMKPRLQCAAWLLALVTMVAGCAVNPVTGRQDFVMMSESAEATAGRNADADVRKEYGVYDLPALQEYVTGVGQRLAQHSHRAQLSFHFTVVDSPEINAFALPGGYIYITRGMMAFLNSEAELAAVLSHEIGHVTARHSVRQISLAQAAAIGATLGSLLVPALRNQGAQDLIDLLGNAWISGYGRDNELEADRLGAEYLARAGYDPQAMVRVIGVLKNQELFDREVAQQEGREPRRYHGLFDTHPDNDTRLKEAVGAADQYAVDAKDARPEQGRRDFLQHIDGIVYGDSPQQGVVRGSQFFHAELGIALKFPAEWRVQNRPDKLLAISPRRDALIEMHLIEANGASPADALRRLLKPDVGSRIQATSINGLPAAELSGSRQGRPTIALAIDFHNRLFLLIGSAALPDVFERRHGEMSAALRSFRAITDAQRKLAKPLRLHTRPARQGQTYAQLAAQSPLGSYAEQYLRLMNSAYPAGEPIAGESVKVVE